MKNKVTKKEVVKRPVIITVLCIMAFLGLIGGVFLVFMDISRSIGAWYPPYLAVCIILGLICFIGLWKMKKWSAIAYAIFVAINQVIMAVVGIWSIGALIMPLIVVVIMFWNYKYMK